MQGDGRHDLTPYMYFACTSRWTTFAVRRQNANLSDIVEVAVGDTLLCLQLSVLVEHDVKIEARLQVTQSAVTKRFAAGMAEEVHVQQSNHTCLQPFCELHCISRDGRRSTHTMGTTQACNHFVNYMYQQGWQKKYTYIGNHTNLQPFCERRFKREIWASMMLTYTYM